MGKKGMLVAVAVVAVAVSVAGTFMTGPGENKFDINTSVLFHATLADPTLYQDGIYVEMFEVADGGEYIFDFVPNGSSPDTISITLTDDDSGVELFAEVFVLMGTEHEAGLGEYYTWEYVGEHNVSIPADNTTVTIVIDPNGNTAGSISVYILEN